MKKLKGLFICLCLISVKFNLFAAVNNEIYRTDFTNNVNYDDLSFSVIYKAAETGYSSCNEGIVGFGVAYRLDPNANWIHIYGDSSRFPGSSHQNILADRVDNFQRNGDLHYTLLKFKDLPAVFFNSNVEVKIEARWGEIGCSGRKSWRSFLFNFNKLNEFSKLKNLRTAKDYYCNFVRLDWDLGDNLTDTTDFYQIYRRKMPNGTWALLDSTFDRRYDDSTVDNGALYQYRVKTFARYLGPKYAIGQDSVDGSIPEAVTPNSVYINQVSCQGDLEVNWSYTSGNNPDHFLIFRSDKPDFSDSTKWTVSGIDRNFRDYTAVSGKRYYYWVKSLVLAGSGCGIESDTSSVVTEVGNGVPAAQTISSINSNFANKTVSLSWTDSTNLEDHYKVVRSSGNGVHDFILPKNSTSYTDSSASSCVNYTYRLYALNNQCASNGVVSTNSKSTYLKADIKSTFTNSNHGVSASDGEFGNRIELSWRTNNRQNDNWVIHRINPMSQDTVLIASLSGSTRFFIDQTANANTLYEYMIHGELDCSGTLQLSDTAKDVGFRLAYGTINGQVTYSGGTAVKGVKVTATSTSGASGYSASFNGSNSLGTVAHSPKLASDEITAMAYIRTSDANKLQSIFEKHDGANGFKFRLNRDSLQFVAGNTVKQALIPNFAANDWIAVAATASQDSIILYVNGQSIAKYTHSSSVFNDSSNATIGKLFEGEIDELRVFDRVLANEEVLESYNVYINPSMDGLVGYWRFDENFGNKAYDYSKTILNSNKNHANLNNVSWSNLKPSTAQLTAGAYTDSLGSYYIPFIPYLGSGDNYTIVPEFGTHSFSPATTTLMVGSGSENYTNQNFTDNSSFTVSGTVKYKNTSCFVKDARLKIDGEVVITNGEIETTDAQGRFEIQVPIGPHVVSVEQTKHVYSAGRFPSSGTHDFQQNVQGIEFVDSTLVRVVGRVAGGSIQKGTLPALGRGKNNIGLAKVPFKSQQGGGCLVDTANTDALTGEYFIDLPPMRYEIPNFTVESNAAIQFNNNTLLDVTTIPPIQTSKDSVYRDSLGHQLFVRVDSAHYQTQRDFIYYVSPSVDVMGEKSAEILGADTLRFEESGINVEIPVMQLDSGDLKHPTFYENEKYSWVISAFEVYENKDNPFQIIKDSVPMVEGNILITNNLARNPKREFNYSLKDSITFNGIQKYEFYAGQANTTIDALNADNNFTKTCEITLLPHSGNAVNWKVNNETFRGIIFGGRALGNTFSTSGPDVVTMILRDPPGTNSFASWQSGKTITSVKSWENAGGLGFDLNKNIALGTEFTVGLGYSTTTEVSNDLNSNTKIETSVNEKGELVEARTTNVTISTGDGDDFVGAGADLFFGRAMNMDFGISEILTLIDTSNCGGNANCYGDLINHQGNHYKLGITNSMFMIPKGYETQFVYTQAGIENSVIPKLIGLRNQLLSTHPDYNSFLNPTHVNYGKSNDDPVFGTSTPSEPEINTPSDSTGSSYEFSGYRIVDTLYTDTIRIEVDPFPPYTKTYITEQKLMTVVFGVDSVWWYNRQIALWENTLAANEKAKVNSTNPQRNISYQGGSSISYSSSSTRTSSETVTVNFNLNENLTLKIGAKVGGAGVEIEQSTSMSYTHATNIGSTNETTTTFEYTLSDSDADDDFTVDVFSAADGYGPIFKTRGGQTSCPYQGETKTKYYNKGTVIDNATIQLEQPEITVSPAELFNVPAKDAGNFTLNLINNGSVDNVYAMRIMENTNPYGAILKIDGIGPNRDFAVPAKTTITKTLTVEKGASHIAYDSIGIIFHSKCQYSFGTANYEDIADTVYISINFLPSCTDIDVQSPQNQFVANTSFNNTLPVVISGYDINYGGLEKIQLQYKPSNQASWVPIGREWFKDTTNIDSRYPNHPDPQMIPRGQSYITYPFEMDQLIDQDYDLRAISTCKIPSNPEFDQSSTVISGVFDRVNPHPFGSPTPADGVLDPNDDISIQFNEDIEAGSLNPDNFQLTGVLNGQELKHDKAVAFDGATGYLEIANGFDFASNNFTIEFWAKRNTLGNRQTVIAQGTSTENLFEISFNQSNKVEVTVGEKTYESNFAILDDSTWNHYAITYDKDQLTLEISNRFQSSVRSSSNNNFYASFQSGGKTYVGKNANSSSSFFNGSIHELRIWGKALSPSIVSSRVNNSLTGRESGLIGYWPMNEGRGDLAEDKARFRHAEMKANWEINPKSTAASFDGVSQYVVVDSAGTLAIDPEMDLSIEFWFKTTGGQLQSFLSNGSGRFANNDVNRNGWNIEMNVQNEIWVKNDSFAFKAVETDYADNEWHHFALVVNRLSNTTAYVDGNQQESVSSVSFFGFGASKLVIGARYRLDGTIETFDQHLNGHMDEVRIWSTALLRENIELNQYNRLMGDEFGLLAYYPFESHRLELGVPILDSSLENQSTVLTNPSRINAKAVNGSVFTSESPAVALQRPVEKIKFSWSVNGDKIVITPNETAANIENVTLNIAVQGIKDLHGNFMQSPKTWLAYVNKNQVLWQDTEKNLSKEFNDTLSFSSRVVNSGGEVKSFTISNIPPWLTVSPSSGTIDPLEQKTIHFTVNPSVNIGSYSEDIILTTDFGFNEKLLVNLKVAKTPPNFNVDPSLYQHSMSAIGQIRINGVVSTNEDDILVAYINEEVRGVANLAYVPSYDKYLAFIDVYSNNSSDSVYFKVWNSASGELHSDVTPSINFSNNSLIGTPSSPQYFDAIDNILKSIALKKGWNWVSFPLTNTNMNDFQAFFKSLNLQEGDLVKTIGDNANAQYGGPSIGWAGNLVNRGLQNELSYLIKLQENDTLMYKGLAIDPDTVKIDVFEGWNRIGFISLKNMQLNTALANFSAQDGDLLKSHEQFAYYDQNLGWIGSLEVLEPTKGYFLKSSTDTSFVYPRQGLLRMKSEIVSPKSLSEMIGSDYTIDPHEYESPFSAIIGVEGCQEAVENKNIGLAAFNENEFRGWSEAATKPNKDLSAQYYLTAYGETNDQFKFALIDTLTKQVIHLSGNLSYEKNGIAGTPYSPIVLSISKEECESYKSELIMANEASSLVYPNPFKDRLFVVVPSDLGEMVEVSLVDNYGRVLYQEMAVANEKLDWGQIAGNKNLAKGVYYVRFKANDALKIEKVIKH